MDTEEAKRLGRRKRGRQQYIWASLLGLLLNAGLVYILLTRSTGTHAARMAAWVIVPVFTLACGVIAEESIRRKPEDAFFELFDLEK